MAHEAQVVTGYGSWTEAAALEAKACERGRAAGQLARGLLRDFPGWGDGSRFQTPEEVLSVQHSCPHPSARWVHGRCHDSFVCECCRAVLEEGWPDHHPEISRWVNEGGAAAR